MHKNFFIEDMRFLTRLCHFSLDYVGECPLRHGWSKYFDESDPIGRFGEFEVLSEIRRKNPGSVCSLPTAVGAKLLSGQPYLAGGENLQLVPSSGLVCFSAFQSDGRCNDYKVRFCCPGTYVFALFTVFTSLQCIT